MLRKLSKLVKLLICHSNKRVTQDQHLNQIWQLQLLLILTYHTEKIKKNGVTLHFIPLRSSTDEMVIACDFHMNALLALVINCSLICCRHQVGWLGFNVTFSINRPYRVIKKIKVC